MKKVKFISVMLVLSFILMGAAYAAWTENIVINGTVATGDYDVTFSAATSNDPGVTVDPGLDKHVGTTDNPEVATDGKSITVTANNAYPDYNATINYTVKNTGTIPLKVTGLDITNYYSNQLTVAEEGATIVGEIIDAGAEISKEIKHTVLDGAAENSTYSYTVTVQTQQWNR
ncbi:MAG: hypothetical protein PHC60_08845 [Heliobacteriaceae bacterium]|nr:hypothetical protein [Heliobacteriaceae bacterium]MDD4588480.1 hypothetical protein [Heliobacteriaceae bacterium]